MVLRSLLAATGAPAWLDAAPDWRVAAFALVTGFLSAIFFGLTPALQVGRQRHRGKAVRQILIGAQVAASCVLLIVAGLLGRALVRATSSPLGFEYKQVISLDAGLAKRGYTPASAQAHLETLQSRLRTIPGVQAVALAVSPPLGHVNISAGLDIDGRQVNIALNRVDSHFLETMKIPLLRGRNLTRADTRAAVLSESAAHAIWPGADPLGKNFPLGEGYTVVGIAGNVQSVKFAESRFHPGLPAAGTVRPGFALRAGADLRIHA